MHQSDLGTAHRSNPQPEWMMCYHMLLTPSQAGSCTLGSVTKRELLFIMQMKHLKKKNNNTWKKNL